MKELLLLLLTLSMFTFGYFLMVKVDRAIKRNQNQLAQESRFGRRECKKGAECACVGKNAAQQGRKTRSSMVESKEQRGGDANA